MAYRIEQTGVELQGILNDAVLTKQELEDEVARAQAAEGVLQENIDSEAGERQSADALLAGNIGTEVVRAQQAESDLGARVDANAAGVAAEVARAQEAEGQVWDTLNDEILTRQSQDAALQGNIEREAGLREAGDGQLQGEIDAISGKIPSAASEMNQLADKQYVQDSIGDAPTREEVEEIKAVIPAAASESNKLVDTATFDDVASTVATLQGLYAELRDGKADKAATLAGYGIEDAYTKDAVDEMIGALSRNEIVVGPLPQTGEEGVIYRVPGNGYYTDYMYYDGSFMELAQYSMEFDQTQVGYFTCDTEAGTAAKTVSATGYTLAIGGNIRIKMTNANTADSVTLNINGTGAKALYYDGEQASSTNAWEAGEVLEVYFDGTQFVASNSVANIDTELGEDKTGIPATRTVAEYVQLREDVVAAALCDLYKNLTVLPDDIMRYNSRKKKILVFGASIEANARSGSGWDVNDPRGWLYWLNKAPYIDTIYNFANGSSCLTSRTTSVYSPNYRTANNTINIYWNQIIHALQRYLAGDIEVPDVVLICSGGNDIQWTAYNRQSIFGDTADEVFSTNMNDFNFSGYTDEQVINGNFPDDGADIAEMRVNMLSIAKAVRYISEIIYTYWPETQIIWMGNMYTRGGDIPRDNVENRFNEFVDKIESCCVKMSIPCIRSDKESGRWMIYEMKKHIEAGGSADDDYTQGGAHPWGYTADGYHPTVKGAELFGRYMINKLASVLRY